MEIKSKKYLLRAVLIAVLALVVYFTVTPILYMNGAHQSECITRANFLSEIPVGEITKDTIIEQTIPIDENMTGFSARFATYDRTNVGTVSIQAVGVDSGKVYLSQEKDAASFADNSDVWFSLSEMADAGTDSALKVTVTADSEAGSAVTIWSSNEDKVPEGTLRINGVTQDGDLNLKVTSIVPIPYWTLARAFHVFYILVFSCIFSYFGFPRKFTLQGYRRQTEQHLPLRSADRQDLAAGICFLLCGVLLFILIRRNLYGDYTALQVSRKEFYALTALFALAIFFASKHHNRCVVLLIIFIALGLLILDRDYSIYDEYFHLLTIQHIADYGYFPTAFENYEAVQGPVYYYLLALLIGWLPEGFQLIAGRLFGFICLILFGYLSRRTLELLERADMISVEPELRDIVWLLFVFNPCIITRITRVSNESLVLALAAIVLYFSVKQFINGYDQSTTVGCTVLCAVLFLTKSTAVFMFGMIMILCIYFKKWRQLIGHFLLEILLAGPWFVYNYLSYGSLTNMQWHIDWMFTNGRPSAPDLFENVLHFFDSYFFNTENGIWFDYTQIDTAMSSVLFLIFVFSVAISLKHLAIFLRNRLQFSYDSEERSRLILIAVSMLPLSSMIMHAISSARTYLNSLVLNRYLFMMNGGFCILLLMALSKTSVTERRYVRYAVTGVYAFLITSMIYSYLQIILF